MLSLQPPASSLQLSWKTLFPPRKEPTEADPPRPRPHSTLWLEAGSWKLEAIRIISPPPSPSAG
ncbi:hypothetical protein D779_3678 [Imhoffiella purpurea]|uniref:Uncharacterized protein n=1 Tax=Imhoffiella purpurea TaxID=1249627 RepID=W9V1Z2_9GAMM|nr:hypothetical protein D779_3678 [Imhoffiella purpurea]